MDLKKLKKLIELVESSNISALSIEEEQTKIDIRKEVAPVVTHATIPQAMPTQAPITQPTAASPVDDAPDTDAGLIPIPSPMVGTFYEAQSPESPAFVKVGQTISKGDIVCIVEAMKLFNEIESEVSGTIERVCVSNGDAVEFGQPLFMIRQ